LRRRSAPFLFVLLPAAILALLLALLLQRPHTRVDVVPPVASDPDQTVAAFAGRIDGADGSRLVARLAPLHADPDRQRFEASSLQRRLDLEAGEPWRFSLRWDGPEDPDGTGGAASGVFGAEGPARGEPRSEAVGLGLGPLEVHDAGGRALSSIRADELGDGVVDPLRTLFAPPGGALRHGQAVDWVLWGRRPVDGAQVVGLLPLGGPDAEAFEASTGLRGPLTLEPKPVRRSEMQLPVAWLDRTGKIPPGGPSEGNGEPAGAEHD
jgi:hypothetical protein